MYASALKKKPEFDLAQFNKKPVSISHFRINKNYENNNVVMNNKTVIHDSNVTSDGFKRIDIPDTLDINSLANVAAEQLVSFKGKVMNLTGPKTFQTQKGNFRKQEGFVIDQTASMRIVLWGDYVNELHEDATYNFTGLQLKQVDAEKYVNTPKGNYFKYEETTAFEEPLPGIQDLSMMRNIDITVDIIGVTSVTKYHACRACNRKLSMLNDSTKVGTCTHCKMMQKSTSETANWFAKLYMQESSNAVNKLTLTANNFILTKMPDFAHLDFHLTTVEQMIEHLLNITAMPITYDPTSRKILDINVEAPVEDELQ